QWTDADGIDEEIIAAIGALPADPAELEVQRRMRLLSRLRAGFRQPETLSEQWLDGWLAGLGVTSVGELLAGLHGQPASGALHIGFSAPTIEAPAPRPLLVAVALLIRDKPLAVSQL